MNAISTAPTRTSPLSQLVGDEYRIGLPELRERLSWRRAGVAPVFPQRELNQCERTFIENTLTGLFEFNGEAHRLPLPFDWRRNPSQDREWQIVLHKFYFAVGLADAFAQTGDTRYARAFETYCLSWMDQVDAGFIATDVTARRIQNWIYAWYIFSNAPTKAPFSREFIDRFFLSLTEQTHYVTTHLAPARNHRTLALFSVFLAGVAFPELQAAHQWIEFANRELIDNLHQDFLADGVHVELSSDYHHLVLRSFLLWIATARANHLRLPEHDLSPTLHRALDFALHVHRPDGFIPALSDADSRSFLDLLGTGAQLFARDDLLYAASGGKQGRTPLQTSRAFPSGGYYFMRSGWSNRAGSNAESIAVRQAVDAFGDESYVVIDCGPLGAGNHGHLDALSLEYYAQGQPLIVDPGRYTYDESGATNWRAHFRCTAAHNTVTVDDLDQAAYRYSQKHARMRIQPPHAQCVCEAFDTRGEVDYFRGLVRSAQYGALHWRQVLRVRRDYLLVVDVLNDVNAPHRYCQHWHLAEEAARTLQLETTTHTFIWRSSSLLLAQPRCDGLTTLAEADFVAKDYGHKLDSQVVRFKQEGNHARFVTLLMPCAPSRSHSVQIADDSRKDWIEIKVESDRLSYRDVITLSEHPRPRRIEQFAFYGNWSVFRFSDDSKKAEPRLLDAWIGRSRSP